MTLIHAADLHLRDTAGERDYGLAVLDEILELVHREEADLLLFAGDLFDSYDDAEALRAVVAERIASLPQATETLLLPGNHELLRAGGRSFDRLQFGELSVASVEPFSRRVHQDVEFILIPHQQGYADYLDWEIPERGAGYRVVVAHATVAGLYYDDSGEEGGSSLDPDLLTRFGADYLALGHIHAGQELTLAGAPAVYPGSARVWRRGETGARSVVRVDLDGETRWTRLPLHSAGQYRRVAVSVDPDGSTGAEIDELPLGPADSLELVLNGVVESDALLKGSVSELRRRLEGQVRELRIHGDGVILLDGVAEEPIVRRFLDVWEREGRDLPGEKRSLWYRARELGLQAVKDLIEQKK